MRQLHLTALGLAIGVCSVVLGAQTPADPTAAMFARDRVLRIDLDLDAADWREIRLSHRDAADETLSQIADDDAYQYKQANIRIDGVPVARVGVRKKGFLGSVVSTRPSLKVKFDEYVNGQTFSGLDGLTLNNNNQDRAMVQTFLAYDLFARAGVPASRANFAHVRVNGEDLGVYTHVEAIGRPFLRRAFGSTNGVLYESYAGDFNTDRFYRIVEKSGGQNQDRTRLEALKDALAVAGPVSAARISELVDLDSFIRMWAIESLMGHWDSYSGNRNNYYLYVNPTTKKLHFIPWGPDSVFADPGPLQPAVVPKSFKAMGILSRRLWELPDMRARYQAVMRELLAGPWTESRIAADMSTLQKTLLPMSHLQAKTVETASASILTFVKTRRAEVLAELTSPGPAWPAEATPPTPVPMTLSGSFSAPWSTDAPIDPLSGGTSQFEVAVGGKPIGRFVQSGAFSTTHKQGDAALIAPLREKYHYVVLTGRIGAEVWQVSFTIDPFRLVGPGVQPVDHYSAWALVVQVPQGRGPRVRLFGNVGELRLEQADARAGGTLRGTFTLRGFAP
jgi:hypothetical protein